MTLSRAFAEGVDEDAELSLEDLEGVGGGKGFAPLALAAIMTFTTISATLTGCSSTNSISGHSPAYIHACAKKYDDNGAADMNRDDTEEKFNTNAIMTEYNKAGAYNVTFTESDLIFAKDSKDATDEVDPDFTLDQATVDDIKVQYVVTTYPEAAEGEEAPEPVTEVRDAAVDEFSVDGGSFSISFTDPDAAENKTSYYIIYIEKLGAVTFVSAEFADHTLYCDTETVVSNSEENEIKLTAAEGSFAEDISEEDIKLEGSFKDMSVDSVSANGNELTVKLSGSPVLEEEICTTFTAGIITVYETGFVNGTEPHSAFIDVEAPGAFVDMNGMGWEDGLVVVPIKLTGAKADEITADDVKFEKGVPIAALPLNDKLRYV